MQTPPPTGPWPAALRRSRAAAVLTALAAIVLASGTPVALADGDGGARLGAAQPPAAYREECGACHLPYPAEALPAESWASLMATLDRHFGSDASLDPQLTQTLSLWLQAHAAGGRRATGRPADNRITRADWFLREHDEVDPAVWRRAGARQAGGVSPSQCNACHTRAAEGSYREREIRIPR